MWTVASARSLTFLREQPEFSVNTSQNEQKRSPTQLRLFNVAEVFLYSYIK